MISGISIQCNNWTTYDKIDHSEGSEALRSIVDLMCTTILIKVFIFLKFPILLINLQLIAKTKCITFCLSYSFVHLWICNKQSKIKDEMIKHLQLFLTISCLLIIFCYNTENGFIILVSPIPCVITVM